MQKQSQSSPRKLKKNESQRNINWLFQSLVNNIQQIPKGQSPFQELQLKYNQTDEITKQQDIEELEQLLRKYLSYPSTQIAEIHMKAGRLGILDLAQNHNAQRFQQIIKSSSACPCCGFLQQPETLKLCTNILNVKYLGASTYFYFMTLQTIIGLLIVQFFLYSIYSVVTNILSSIQYKQSVRQLLKNPKLMSYESFLLISLGSKLIHETQTDRHSFQIQCWLGLTVIFIWGLFFVLAKKIQTRRVNLIEKNSITASDFTILIRNYPQNFKIQQLQAQMQQYYNKNQGNSKNKYHESNTKFKIIKINQVIPFYLEQSDFNDKKLKQLNQQCQKYRQIFAQWIKQRRIYDKFTVDANERTKVKQQFLKIKEERDKMYEQISSRIIEQKNELIKNCKRYAYVTFSSNYIKQFFVHEHRNSHSILNKLPCRKNSKQYFHFKNKNNQNMYMAKILKAPQPQDIIWTNLGKPANVRRRSKFYTYLITLITLTISFIIVYGLSLVQVRLQQKIKNLQNSIFSILITVSITIFNFIIQRILRFLTKLQRLETRTDYQGSLAFKAIWAIMINSIAIPILVNYFIKQNLYGIQGLAYQVFYLSILNAFVTPLLKIFHVQYLISRVIIWYKTHPVQKLYMNQNQLNATAEYLQFQTGYEYIYVVNLFLFTCFFVSLQPIIVIFSISGLLLMIWTQKFYLFNRCQRPTPGNGDVNNLMYNLIYCGPLVYTIGSFCWSHFFKHEFISVLPNFFSFILSIIVIVLPYRKVIKKFFNFEHEVQRIYEKDRIFMPSQYDRLNPLTANQAIQSYINFLSKYKEELKKKPQELIKSFQNQIIDLYGVGNKRNQGQFILFDGLFQLAKQTFGINNYAAFNQKNILLGKKFGAQNGVVSPFILAQTLILDHKEGFNMSVQSWEVDQKRKKKNINQIRSKYRNNIRNNRDQKIVMNFSKLSFDEAKNDSKILFKGIKRIQKIRLNYEEQQSQNIEEKNIQESNQKKIEEKDIKFNIISNQNHEDGDNINNGYNNQKRPIKKKNSIININKLIANYRSNLPVNLFGNLLLHAQQKIAKTNHTIQFDDQDQDSIVLDDNKQFADQPQQNHDSSNAKHGHKQGNLNSQNQYYLNGKVLKQKNKIKEGNHKISSFNNKLSQNSQYQQEIHNNVQSNDRINLQRKETGIEPSLNKTNKANKNNNIVQIQQD